MSAQHPDGEFLDELSKVNRKLRTLFDARAKRQGLTLSRARLLLQLAQQDGRTQSELAEALDIEQPTLVRLIDGLEAKGFVRRQSVEGDRRARSIFLTVEARNQADDILDFTVELRAQVLDGVDAADLASATRVLSLVARNIGAAS